MTNQNGIESPSASPSAEGFFELRNVRALAMAIVMGLVVGVPSAGGQTFEVLYAFPLQSGPSGIINVAGSLFGTTFYGGNGLGTVFKLDAAGNETVLHTFTGIADGQYPEGGVISHGGNLYGTTSEGPGGRLGGTVFRIDKTTGEETLLYSFQGGNDGAYLVTGVVADSAGNLYGTTLYGPGTSGGTIYKLDTATRRKTFQFVFTDIVDGFYPESNLIRDAAGNLYGTTFRGGSTACDSGHGCGTVFKVDAAGSETVLYDFSGVCGSYPQAGVIEDAAGNFYGTTTAGGTFDAGTVFKLDASGKETVLYNFTGGVDGNYPVAPVIEDAAGNLYGTTVVGGTSNKGTVFKLDAAGTLTVLHSFAGGADGAYPSMLVWDKPGVLYGIAGQGGTFSGGTVFKITL